MLLAVDTETTGPDFFHGCKPFLVTGCDGKTNYFWEGKVNEYTRSVSWSAGEVKHLQHMLDTASNLIFQNANFDRRALDSIGIITSHLVPKIEDTLVASHVLCSGDVHGLKEIAIKYLRYFDDDERYLQDVIPARRLQLANQIPTPSPGNPNGLPIAIAREGHPHFPAMRGKAGQSWWKQDMWLDMEACRIYGSKDTERTYLMWLTFIHGLMNQDLVKVYRRRMELLPVLYDMQTHGIPIYVNKCTRLIKHLEFQLEAVTNLLAQHSNWKGYLNVGSPQHLEKLLFSPKYLGLEPINTTEGGTNSTDKESLKLLFEENPDVPALQYLQAWREVSTELSYVQSYVDWSVLHLDRQDPSAFSPRSDSKDLSVNATPTKELSFRIHSSINLTGTKWTRQSSSSPNQQNFKSELKYLFGPPEGYYWLYMDVVNIELRVWAYEVGSKLLIKAFESGESVHMIIARTIRQHQIDMAGGESVWKKSDPLHKQYTDTKGGTFAWIYGGSTRKVNNTYGIPNAQSMIKDKLPEVGNYFDQLTKTMEGNRERYGYPTIFTRQGYKLEVPRNKPYSVPSARIQGSASEIVQDMMLQLVKTEVYKNPLNFIRQSNQSRQQMEHWYNTNPKCSLIQQVHDSLTIQIPQHDHSEQTNAEIIKEVERVGCLHIPTCPMDGEVILPSANQPIRVRIHSILPEKYMAFEVTYFFQDDIGWIARAKYESLIIEGIGKTQQEAYNTLTQKITK